MQCESMLTPVVHCEFRLRDSSDAGNRHGPLYWIVRCSPDVERDYQSRHASRAAVPPTVPVVHCEVYKQKLWVPTRSAVHTPPDCGSRSNTLLPSNTVNAGLKRRCSSSRSGGGPRLGPSLVSCVAEEHAQWSLPAAALFRAEFVTSTACSSWDCCALITHQVLLDARIRSTNESQEAL